MISESECENPNNDFLREDSLDCDFGEILTQLLQCWFTSKGLSPVQYELKLSCAHSSHAEVPYDIPTK